MSYCICLRKSRADLDAEAHEKGETLPRYEKLLLEVAKRRSLNNTEIYREIVSGENIFFRPVVQQLLSAVEQGLWEGVLVVEIERLARSDTIDQGIIAQTFKYSDTKIVAPTLERSRPINERIQSASASIKELTQKIKEGKKRLESQKEIIPKIEHPVDVYYDWPTPAAKNELPKKVLEKLVYFKERKTTRADPPDLFGLTIYPKLHKIDNNLRILKLSHFGQLF